MSEKNFYQKLYPELFSDSRTIKKGALSEEMFQMYLENLTSQNKEKEFENFCRKLIEVTICPNLLPQTGPTGGGDSKVDSETYPVSEEISETWLTGFAEKAYEDRWAFAISAKKEWRSKCKSDVKKIVKTNEELARDYKKIFFLTNQFVSDKKRADLEDELRREYSIDIRILDRTWLTDNTFKDDNIMIAIKAFNMSDLLLDEVEEGTLDIQRKRHLDDIDEELSNLNLIKPSRIVKLSNEYIKNSRELQVDKSTVISALERNVRFAKKYGTKRDYITAIYDYAWTMIWWYEDRDVYYEKYLELEGIFEENLDHYYILQYLSTLWITLYTNHKSGIKIIDEIENHTTLLTNAFKKFIEDEHNPNRSLLARYDFQFMRMQLSDDYNNIIEEYIDILNHVNFNNKIDLLQIKKVLELPILKEELKYDELFEKVIIKLSEIKQNKSSSEMLINRGDDYFQKKDNNKAIMFYSRALMKLYQEDSKEELIKTLLKLGFSFENIGLIWGARSYYLRAYTYSFNLYFEEGVINPGLFLSLRYLKNVELSLGRIDHALEVNEIEMNGFQLYPYNVDEEFELEGYLRFDGLLAIVILNMPLNLLEDLNQLPDYLSDWALDTSSAALKYQLGYYDNEFTKSLGSEEEVDKFMEDLFNSPVSNSIIVRDIKSKVQIFETMIFGCKILIKVSNDKLAQEFGASILALLENAFAIVELTTFKPVLDLFKIEVQAIPNNEFGIEIELIEKIVKLKISSIENLVDYANREIVFEKLIILLSIFISKMVIFEEDFERFKMLLENDNVLFRIFNHSITLDTFISFEDNNFVSLEDYSKYPLKREEIIFTHSNDKNSKVPSNSIHFKSDKEIDFSNITHKSMITSNIIDIPLWNKASWQGIFATPANTINNRACIGLIFSEVIGLEIFKDWKNHNDDITIGVISGIDKNNPLWYRVIIGDDIFSKKSFIKNFDYILGLTFRLHTMEAQNTNTIKILREIVDQEEFIFIPVLVDDIATNNYRFDLGIILKAGSIIIKDVSEIDENDHFLHQGILPSDSPVNPDNKERFIEKLIKEKENYKE